MGRSVLAALEVRNLTARKLVADLRARDLLVRIMIHTSYSGSTYNTQEDISDASVLLNKFNTGDGQGKVWDGYCLAHLFTYWVLSNGLLGLSNIASPSATTTGGICSTTGVSCTVQVEMICKNGNAKTYTSCNTHQSDAAEVDVTRTESTDAELNEGDLLQITGFSCTVQVEICKNGTLLAATRHIRGMPPKPNIAALRALTQNQTKET
ncbi:hypothetical protein EMCRGX_G026996 [Ephydatia muelleri]